MLPALLGYFPHPRGGSTGWAGARPGVAGLSQLPWPQHAGERPRPGRAGSWGCEAEGCLCPGLSPGVTPGPYLELPGPAAPQSLCLLSRKLAAGARAQPRGDGTTVPGPAQSLYSSGMCWRYLLWSRRSMPQDPRHRDATPQQGRWYLSLRAGPPAASGSASDRLYLDRLSRCRLTGGPWPEAGARSSPAPAVPISLPHSRSRCLAPSSPSREAAGTSAGTLLLAGITHLPQASPREGPSRAPAPAEGIGSLHAAVPGDRIPWDPRKRTGRDGRRTLSIRPGTENYPGREEDAQLATPRARG